MENNKLNFQEFKDQLYKGEAEFGIARPLLVANRKFFYEKCNGNGILYKYVIVDKKRCVKCMKVTDKDNNFIPYHLLTEYLKYRQDVANNFIDIIEANGLVSNTTDLNYTDKETFELE